MVPHELPEAVAARLSDGNIAALQICLEYPSPQFAGAWIGKACAKRGLPFRQGWLQTLVREGLLVKGDVARGGDRRYYQVADREWARRVLSYAPVPGVCLADRRKRTGPDVAGQPGGGDARGVGIEGG